MQARVIRVGAAHSRLNPDCELPDGTTRLNGVRHFSPNSRFRPHAVAFARPLKPKVESVVGSK
jgi:hypothetical protein